MLPDSKLYTFIDSEADIAINFLEGQKLIHDLVLTHTVQPNAFSFFRDLTLSAMPIITLLKGNEYVGVYIDAEEPYFRFKIETGFSGHMRTLLLPDDFESIPQSVTGVCRIVKSFHNKPGQNYTSIIELTNTKSDAIINTVLNDSFQLKSSVHLSSSSDQSILLTTLPKPGKDSTVPNSSYSKEYWLKKASSFNDLFAQALTDPKEIKDNFEKLGCKYLATRDIQFHCPCSREQFLVTLKNMNKSGQAIFEESQETIETKCDYCQTKYSFTQEEICN